LQRWAAIGAFFRMISGAAELKDCCGAMYDFMEPRISRPAPVFGDRGLRSGVEKSCGKATAR